MFKKNFYILEYKLHAAKQILCVKTAAGAKSLRNIKVREYDASNTSCEGQSTWPRGLEDSVEREGEQVCK